MELHSPRLNPYSSLQTVVDHLEGKGYKEKFTIEEPDKMHDSKGIEYSSEDLAINEIHRLVNKENETEKTAVYAISSKSGKKGIVVDRYGEEGNEVITKFLMNVDSHDALHK